MVPMSAKPPRFGVVGAGIVGLAIARRLTELGYPVTVLDKEDRVAAHQTGHNSGVVHAGLYYQPGSLKATAVPARHDAARGVLRQARPALRRRSASWSWPATRARCRASTRSSAGRGSTRCPSCAGSPAAEIAEIEPHARGVAALHSPRTAIVDYVAVAEAYADDVRSAGGEIVLGAEVTGLQRGPGAHHGGRVRLRPGGGLRRAAVRPGQPAGRRHAGPGDRAVPRRVLPDPSRAHRPGPRPDLPGARPALPVPRRAPDPPGRRLGRGRPQRGARAGPRGLRLGPDRRRRPLADPACGPASGAWPANIGVRACAEMHGSAVPPGVRRGRPVVRARPAGHRRGAGRRRACAPRRWTPTARWSTTSASTTAAR